MILLNSKGLELLRAVGPTGHFMRACVALAEIRNRTLYRDEYPDFKSYLEARVPQVIHLSSVSGFTIDEVIDMGCQLQQVKN